MITPKASSACGHQKTREERILGGMHDVSNNALLTYFITYLPTYLPYTTYLRTYVIVSTYPSTYLPFTYLPYTYLLTYLLNYRVDLQTLCYTA